MLINFVRETIDQISSYMFKLHLNYIKQNNLVAYKLQFLFIEIPDHVYTILVKLALEHNPCSSEFLALPMQKGVKKMLMIVVDDVEEGPQSQVTELDREQKPSSEQHRTQDRQKLDALEAYPSRN